MLDALGRRLRWRQPTPPDKTLIPQERDRELYRLINRHGPLPSTYLHKFVGGDPIKFKQRLSDLFDFGYLVRYPQYAASFHARYSPIVYGLGEKAILNDPLIHRNDPMIHRLMAACVSASVEFECLREGATFIPRQDILGRAKAKLELSLTSAAPRSRLVPDDLFGIKTAERVRFYAVEIDRNTESIERKEKGNNTFSDKLACYEDVLDTQTYHDDWGIKNLHVLTVTTNDTHAKNLQARVKTHPHKFIFKSLPTFGADWRTPKDPFDLQLCA